MSRAIRRGACNHLRVENKLDYVCNPTWSDYNYTLKRSTNQRLCGGEKSDGANLSLAPKSSGRK